MQIADLKSPSQDTFNNAVSLKHLPSIPQVAMQVIEMCKSDDVHLDELSETIALDPSLSAKLLQYSNSARYARFGEITDVNRACFALGLKTIKIFSIGISVVSTVSGKDDNSKFDYAGYWRRSVLTATAAKKIAARVNPVLEEQAFVCGLLCRIGQIAFVSAFPGEYNNLIQATGNPLPTTEEESEQIGINHHYLAQRLMESWQLPDSISQVVGEWTHSKTDDAHHDVCEIIRLSDAIATSILGREELDFRSLNQAARESFDLDENVLVELLLDLKDDAIRFANMMEFSASELNEFESLMQEARMEVIRVSMETSRDLEVKNEELKNERMRGANLRRRRNDLKKKSETDSLTGAYNRGAFDQEYRSLIVKSTTHSDVLTNGIILFDIDHFKNTNDKLGHLAGDEILKNVTKALSDSFRDDDFFARFGGEEFVVIFPDCDLERLTSIAERTRSLVERTTTLIDGLEVKTTISIGGTVWSQLNDVTEGIEILRFIDELVYLSKDSGRNRCTIREYTGPVNRSATGE